MEKIRAMLEDEPHDTFLRYSLAMEQVKVGDYTASQASFRSLMDDKPPYVPAFFMAAQSLVEQNQIAEARVLLRAGIDEARTQGNPHAAGEMSELLANLGELGE